MPWDLDHWGEMNHGRVLTLSDVVLPGAAVRSGLMQLVLHKGWALTMAGATCRWRHRIRPFMRLTFAQRLVGWDAKFVYLEVTVWHKGTAMAQTLYRAAVRSPRGTIAPQTLIDALAGAEGGVSAHGMDLGQTPDSFAQDGTPPAWVRAWTEAEAQRPWPPEAIS
ncbi:MAG: thioesterase family protein [Pseudomonadota bacterium]